MSYFPFVGDENDVPTLRAIKDPPHYLHDGLLMTLADCFEFFNWVLALKLTPDEKDSLVAYMLAL